MKSSSISESDNFLGSSFVSVLHKSKARSMMMLYLSLVAVTSIDEADDAENGTAPTEDYNYGKWYSNNSYHLGQK